MSLQLLVKNTIPLLLLLATLCQSILFSKTSRPIHHYLSPEKTNINPATSSPLFSRRRGFVDAHLTVTHTRRLSTCISAKNDAVAVAPCMTAPVESAHLKLGSSAMLKRFQEETTATSTSAEEECQCPPQVNTALLHTYHDPKQNVTLCGLNVSKRKFQAWVNHTVPTCYNSSLFSTSQVQLDDLHVRHQLRSHWKQQRLLTDRTELLAIYPSESQSIKKRRGGFPDLLHIYAERLFHIIQDELEEETVSDKHGNIQEILEGGLYGWLQREYEGTEKLCHDKMQHLPVEEQYAVREKVLDVYVDICTACFSSIIPGCRSFNTF